MSVNSHVQIPNCILKHFRSSNGKVFYYDIKTQLIRSTASGKLGVEFGYYSDAIENYLNQEIETPISKLITKILPFSLGKVQSFQLSYEMEYTFKKYITAAIARSNQSNELLYKYSYTAFLVDEQINHDDLVFASTQYNGGIHPKIEKSKMFIVINRSNRKFVVPRNCFYIVHSRGKPCIIAPISPYCSLELVPENNKTGNDSPDEVTRLEFIDNPDIVKRMNQHAFQQEYIINSSFVASSDKKELEELQLYFEDNNEFLFDLKAKCSV